MTEPGSGFAGFEFGVAVQKLAQAVERIDALAERQEAHTARIEAIESKVTLGKGALFGLALGVMFALYGVKETLQSIAKHIAG